MGNLINTTWQPVVSGGEKVIMCECGDESCYEALVVTDHGDQIIEIYADYSDKEEPDFKLFDMPEGYSVCERVLDEAITPAKLEAQRWQPGQTVMVGKRTGQPVLWLRKFVPNHPNYKLCWHTGEHHNGTRLELWTGSGPIIFLPGVRTMPQLRALVSMLSGDVAERQAT